MNASGGLGRDERARRHGIEGGILCPMHRFLAVVGLVLVTYAAPAAAQPVSDLMVEASIAAEADPDTDVTLSVTLTNLGPDDAVDTSMTYPMPAGLTFVSLTAPASWICSTPAVDSTGTISCTLANLTATVAAPFTIVMHVEASTGPGVYLTSIVTAATATFDPNVENDAATAVTQTPPPPGADLFVTIEGPSGSNPETDVTYLIGVHNPGAVEASSVTFTHQLPFAFVSITQTDGPTLTCNEAGQTITCTVATMPAGTSAVFTVVGHTPANAADGTTFQSTVGVVSAYDGNTENDNVPTLLCVQANSCLAGACNANTAVVCDAPDQCHEQATCDTVTGACAPMPKTDGTTCDDADVCTETDTCQSGICTGASPLVCDDANACSVDTCDAVMGCMHVGACPDAGTTEDAGTNDAGTDAGGDAGDVIDSGGGCDCAVGGGATPRSGAYGAIMLVAIGALLRRVLRPQGR